VRQFGAKLKAEPAGQPQRRRRCIHLTLSKRLILRVTVSKHSQETVPATLVAVERTWHSLVARQAKDRRDIFRALPYRLGITDRPDGGWQDYVHHPPLFDLPGYAADLCVRPIRPTRLEQHRRSHHLAGFYGLLIDRVADGQVALDPNLRADGTWLRRAWEDELARALGSLPCARRRIGQTLSRWRKAIAWERAAVSARLLKPDAYREIVALKVDHLFLAANTMLESLEAPPSVRAHAHDVFNRVFLALQCNDDATDAADDKEVAGANTAELLGIRPSALRRSGVHVLDSACRLAEQTWPRMAAWCRRVQRDIDALVPPREALIAELGAMIVVPSLVQRART
jgi:hypothetical protein